MIYGLRLFGTERDIASLLVLADLGKSLLNAAWIELWSPSHGAAIFSTSLTEALAKTLSTRGVDVVVGDRLKEGGYRLRRLDPKQKVEEWPDAQRRDARHLLEAVRPYKIPGDPSVENACFVAPTNNAAVKNLLERLLSLRRDDALLSEWMHQNERLLVIQAAKAPLYLLMRAKEEVSEGVRAYTRFGDHFWVEWGYAHPLLTVAQRFIKEANCSAFVGADGSWRYAPQEWHTHSLYDALTPEFTAHLSELTPAEGKTKFTISLRLNAGPDSEPELWLLSPEELFALEPLIEASSPEALARLTIARTTGPDGVVYVVREAARSGARFGVQLSDTVGKRGFSRAPGTDNLYLPVGRRLTPTMRRDELRTLLRLDQAHAVIIDEDPDGPKIITLRRVEEAPMTQWIEYVATDRRVELDRLIEDAIFQFAEVAAEKPPRPKEEEEQRETQKAPPPPPMKITRRERVAEPKKPEPKPQEEAEDKTAALDEALVIREQIREKEKLVIEGGCIDADVWRTLGVLKARLGEIDEACSCLEAAMFYQDGKPTAETAQELVSLRGKFLGARGTQEELLELAVKREASPSEASYVSAHLLWRIAAKKPLEEEIIQQIAKHLMEPQYAVSRRMAWMALHMAFTRADDKLGLTRAKEKLLGGINDRGLHEAYDLAGFVRFALALEAPGSATLSGARQEQLGALEILWSRTSQKYLKELDAPSGYYRLMFAIGFTRLGASTRARDLIVSVENELSVHDLPNRTLFQLYMSRLAHIATQGDSQGWQREVDGILARVQEPKGKDAVEWLRKRSKWLKGEAAEEPSPWIRPALERPLAAAELEPEKLSQVFQKELCLPELYDYEVTWGIERGLRAALKSGNDELLQEVLSLGERRLSQISIFGHRARGIASCIKAAATLGDAGQVDALIDNVIQIAPKISSLRELLNPVRQALLALRRLGAGEAAQRLLQSLERLSGRGGAEGPQLFAALADGFLQLKELPRAEALLDRAIEDTLQQQLSYEDRFKAAVSILETLPHWPVQSRLSRCEKLIDSLDKFRDTFTVGRFYPTFKVLLFEHIVDAISDDVTLRSDRLKSYLDAEEQGIRRKVLADWNRACGR